MAGQTIHITAADGSGSFAGYLAVPASGSGPGLVIAQEIFGVNATMREVADHFAEEGYVALVPDLFWRMEPGIELGYTPEDWQKAFGYFGKFDVDKGVDDMQAAITALRARPEVKGDGAAGPWARSAFASAASSRTWPLAAPMHKCRWRTTAWVSKTRSVRSARSKAGS